MEDECAEVEPASRVRPPSEAPGMVAIAVLFYGGLALLATAIAWVRGHPLCFIDFDARPISWGVDIGLGVMVAVGTVALSEWMTRATAFGAALAKGLGDALGPLTRTQCVVLAGLSGVGEELLFRGALQPWLGYIATSVLFGSVHFVPRRAFLPWTVFAVLAGFGLGALYAATENLVAPVVAHFGINAINLRRLTRGQGDVTDPEVSALVGDDGDRVDLDPDA